MNPWAAQRRLTILLILGAVVLLVIAGISFKVFYTAPSCFDTKQNQDEEGIDCGGSCPYRCTAQEVAPTVLFTQTLRNSTGRTDIIASIENKNIDVAAKNVPYSVKLYSSTQNLIKEVRGILDLPPRATVPVFIPGVVSNGQVVAHAFLEIPDSAPQWFAVMNDPRVVPKASPPTLGGTPSAPRIEAVLTNQSLTTNLLNVHAVVIVHDVTGNIIAASETVLPSIPAQGRATALFTWNEAFPGVASLIEVVPVVLLP